jgi:hypothetical protein
MYRGSRLAASFFLLLTGGAATAFALGVLPAASGQSRVLVAAAVAFGLAHFVALFGLGRGRAWARTLTVTIAEAGGGLAIAAAFAVVLGGSTFGASTDRATVFGVALWTAAMYALVGISAGRIELAGWARRSHWWPTPLLRVGA